MENKDLVCDLLTIVDNSPVDERHNQRHTGDDVVQHPVYLQQYG